MYVFDGNASGTIEELVSGTQNLTDQIGGTWADSYSAPAKDSTYGYALHFDSNAVTDNCLYQYESGGSALQEATYFDSGATVIFWYKVDTSTTTNSQQTWWWRDSAATEGIRIYYDKGADDWFLRIEESDSQEQVAELFNVGATGDGWHCIQAYISSDDNDFDLRYDKGSWQTNTSTKNPDSSALIRLLTRDTKDTVSKNAHIGLMAVYAGQLSDTDLDAIIDDPGSIVETATSDVTPKQTRRLFGYSQSTPGLYFTGQAAFAPLPPPVRTITIAEAASTAEGTPAPDKEFAIADAAIVNSPAPTLGVAFTVADTSAVADAVAVAELDQTITVAEAVTVGDSVALSATDVFLGSGLEARVVRRGQGVYARIPKRLEATIPRTVTIAETIAATGTVGVNDTRVITIADTVAGSETAAPSARSLPDTVAAADTLAITGVGSSEEQFRCYPLRSVRVYEPRYSSIPQVQPGAPDNPRIAESVGVSDGIAISGPLAASESAVVRDQVGIVLFEKEGRGGPRRPLKRGGAIYHDGGRFPTVYRATIVTASETVTVADGLAAGSNISGVSEAAAVADSVSVGTSTQIEVADAVTALDGANSARVNLVAAEFTMLIGTPGVSMTTGTPTFVERVG